MPKSSPSYRCQQVSWPTQGSAVSPATLVTAKQYRRSWMTLRPGILDSPARARVPSGVCWTARPRIVAESLQAVPDPLLTALRPGPAASGWAVAASQARALTPEESLDPPPPWLLPAQVQSFRRVLAAATEAAGPA